jgi:AcrR family transcriptional regulator
MTSKVDRDHVIAVARELFYGRGFQSVGMDELCRTAGVSRQTFYVMFGSKDLLVAEVITRWHDLFMQGLRAQTGAEASPRDGLLSVFDFLGAWFDSASFRGCGFINAFGELGSVSPSVASLVREHKASFQEHIAELVRDAGAPRTLGPQLAILAEGALTTAAISGTSDPAGQARDAAAVLIAVALAGDDS